MGTYRQITLTCAGALVALGTLSACAGESSTPTTSPTTPTPAAFPTSATYIADVQRKDGEMMTLGITVDGADVAAYACNGTDDEAWFFGEQASGGLDIASRFRDTLQASYDGTGVEGDLTMDGITYEFSAAPAEPPAGVYTADADGTRATWIVRADGSSIGNQFTGGDDDLTVFEKQQLRQAEFREKVRNKRKLERAERLERDQDGSTRSTINGRQVAPRAGGRFLPALNSVAAVRDCLFHSTPDDVDTVAGQTALVDDPAFAAHFAAVRLPGVAANDFTHRLVRSARGALLGGIRFRARDITRPFIEVIGSGPVRRRRPGARPRRPGVRAPRRGRSGAAGCGDTGGPRRPG